LYPCLDCSANDLDSLPFSVGDNYGSIDCVGAPCGLPPCDLVSVTVMQPDFRLHDSEAERIFWDGLERVFQLVGKITVNFLSIRHEPLSDQEALSFAVDLRIEATLLKYAERRKR